MFWDNSTDEMGNGKEGWRGVSECSRLKGQIRLGKRDGKVEKK